MSQTSTKDDAAPATAIGLPNGTRVRALAAWALVFVALLALYYPALSGGFLWDDHENITPPELRTWQGPERIWFQWGATQTYYPVLHTLYWVEQKLWGDATLGYHVASILFHSISVCLVYWIVRRLKIPGALLAAAIFIVHPVYVESIAWITEQKNTLSGMFTLASILVYLHFDESRRRGTYIWSLVLFLLALESKATAVTLPVALVVILWWKRGALSWRRDLAPLAPWFALSLLVGGFTVWYERTYVGVHGEQFVLTPLQKILLASRAVWFYLGKLFWPSALTFIYPRWDINPADAWQYIYVAGVLALVVAAWFVRRRTRAPLAALLFFLGTIFPLLGFFPTYIFSYTYVCDHFQYLPSLGIVVLAAAAISLGVRRVSAMQRYVAQGVCAVALALLAGLTLQQTEMYSDVVNLYQSTIARNPTCWMAHNNLGLELAKRGQSEAATRHYAQALAIRPAYAEAHNNLGIVLRDSGRLDEAIEHFNLALVDNFTYLDAHLNLGIALANSGKLQEAISHFRHALHLNPNSAFAHNDLGNALLDTGRPAEAIAHYRAAIELSPGYAEAHFNLGNALREQGRLDESIPHYRAALQSNPDYADAQRNLDLALRQRQRFEDAIDRFHQALKQNPQDAAAYAELTKTYAAFGRPAEAIATAQQALNLAKSAGQTQLAQQIEAWLTNYRAQQANQP